MDGFERHSIEGVTVDIEVVPAAQTGFSARFRLSGRGDEPAEWHTVHVAEGPFRTRGQAQEAAKSAALAAILTLGGLDH